MIQRDISEMRAAELNLSELWASVSAMTSARLWTTQVGPPGFNRILSRARALAAKLAFNACGILMTTSKFRTTLMDALAFTPTCHGCLGLLDPNNALIQRFATNTIVSLNSSNAAVKVAATSYWRPELAQADTGNLTCSQNK
jgi:hypothetical protein